MDRSNYAELNDTIRYTMWSVFRIRQGALPEERDKAGVLTRDYLDSLGDSGVEVRGVYDVSGMRADADFMIWWHAERIEAVQGAYTGFRRGTPLGQASEPVWSTVGVHRPAEFNKSHVPSFLEGKPPKSYLCVYPFVRSYDWYLLADDERSQMLADHGKAAKGYGDVQPNTVASFALSDYEWVLAFEGDELHRIVDLMRHLRGTQARLHVREETPFYTGHRLDVADLVTRLP